MGIYIFLLLFIYCTSIYNSKKINKVDVILFVLLALVSGFRYGVGTDYFGYMTIFESISYKGISYSVEPGYLLLNILVSKAQLGSQVVFLITSILTMVFFFKGIKYYTKLEYTNKPVLYIIFLVFTYFGSLNGIRQSLAAAIVFYASRYIVERKFYRFSIWVFIAMQFHYSSVIFVCLYFIITKNFKRSTLLVVLLISISAVRLNLINASLEFILQNYKFLDIRGYLTTYLYSAYNIKEVSYGIVFFINIFTLLVFITFKKQLIRNSKDLIAFNFFYAYVLVGILSMDAFAISRLTYYFSIYMAICIPKFSLLFDEKSRKIVEYSLIALYSVLFIYIIISGYINPRLTDFIPYEYSFNLLN